MYSIAAPALSPMPPFDPDTDLGADLAVRWKIWRDDFDTYLVASNITNDKRKRALLLYQAGSRVREIFRNLDDNGEDFQTAVTRVNAFSCLRKIVYSKSIDFVKLYKDSQ